MHLIITLAFLSLTINGFSQTEKSESFTILEFGYMSLEKINARAIVSGKWNINYKSLSGCGVPVGLKDSIKPINDSTFRLIEKKYGIEWNDKFSKEVNKELSNQAKARDLINDKFIQKLPKDTLKNRSDLSIWLEEGRNINEYKARVFGWGDLDGITQIVIFYSLIVNLKNKKVTLLSSKIEKFE